jgi:hypothetical protein
MPQALQDDAFAIGLESFSVLCGGGCDGDCVRNAMLFADRLNFGHVQVIEVVKQKPLLFFAQDGNQRSHRVVLKFLEVGWKSSTLPIVLSPLSRSFSSP